MSKILVDRSVLEQALEALEFYERWKLEWSYADEATITALRAALEQQEQEQEPVAWRYKGMMAMPWSLSDDGYYVSCKRDKGYTVEPLYTHSRREWVSLTEEEIKNAVGASAEFWASSALWIKSVARAVDQALKEKNHD